MRRLLRPLAALLAAAALPLAVSSPAPAAGDAPTYGWWYEPNQSPLNTLAPPPPPPDAPPDGLYLAGTPAGALTEAALRFIVGGASDDATLTLQAVAGASFGAATPVLACPTTSAWAPAQAGDWSKRPASDCTRVGGGVPGVASTDGTTMTWKLSSAFQPGSGTYDVVLLPQGGQFFRVPVKAPGTDALAVPPLPSSTTTTAPATTTTTAPVSVATSACSCVAEPPAPPDFPPSLPASPPQPPALRAARPVTTQLASGLPVRFRPPHTRGQRIMAVTLLLGLAGALWWIGGYPARAPRLLVALHGSRGATAGQEGGDDPGVLRVGGVGRFARPRRERPRRL